MKIRGDMIFTTMAPPKTLHFGSFKMVPKESSLAPVNKLFITLVPILEPGATPFIEFAAMFEKNSSSTIDLNFRDWWNRDIIYRQRSEGKVSPDKVHSFTRRTFIEQIRNKLGAHLDSEVSEQLNLALQAECFGADYTVTLGGIEFSLSAGTLYMKVSPACAMIRQIAYELVQAIRLESPHTP